MSSTTITSNKLKQTYFNGFVDISGDDGNLYIRNNGAVSLFDSSISERPLFSITARNMTVYDESETYYDISNSRFIYIKDVSENVQDRLTDITNRTKHIYGSADMSDSNTMLTFDRTNNNTIIYSNIIPENRYANNLGSASHPFGSVYLNTNAAISLNGTTGQIDISKNGLMASTVLSYGGNVAIGKQTTSPNYTFDVSGNVNIEGTHTMINGISISSTGGMNVPGNLYATYPVNSIPQTSIVGGLDIGNLGTLDVTITNHSAYDNDGFLIFAESINPIEQKVKYNISDLSFNGVSIFQGDISVNGMMTAGTDVFAGRDLFVGRRLSVSESITVPTPTINDSSTKVATTSFVKQLIGPLDVSLASVIQTKAPLNAPQFTGDVSFAGNVLINNSATINKNLYVAGESVFTKKTMVGELAIGGNTSLAGDVSITGQLYANYPNNSIPATAIIGGVGSSALIAVNNTFPETLTYDSDMFTTISHNNTSQGATYDINVNGNLYAAGQFRVTNNAVLQQQLFVGGDVSMNGLTYTNRMIKPLVENGTTSSPYIFDFHSGNVFYITIAPSDQFACYFINIPTDFGRTIDLTLYIESTGQSYFCNSVSINSSNCPLVYLGGFEKIQKSTASVLRQTFTILNTASQSARRVLTTVE